MAYAVCIMKIIWSAEARPLLPLVQLKIMDYGTLVFIIEFLIVFMTNGRSGQHK
jgi:hypothetical protein